MRPSIDHILFQDSWTEEDLTVLRRACAEDAELARLVSQWSTLTAHLRESIDEYMPKPDALVLFALSRAGYSSELTDAEIARLHATRSGMSEILKRHPSVEVILKRIELDAEHFDLLWSEVERSRDLRRADSPRRLRFVSSRMSRAGWSMAAALAITIFALVLSRPDQQTIRTVEGENRMIELADGSLVRMMENSSLTFVSDFDQFDRHVELIGSAYFDVSEGSSEFRVETENAVVRVLGTQFGVVAENTLTEVTLVGGSVSLESLRRPSDPVVLEPGQTSRVRGDQFPSRPESVVLVDALAWARLFIFRDSALSDIVESLSKSFDVTIMLEPALSDEVLTGTFYADQGIQEILEVIADAFGIHLEADTGSGTYRLRS